MAEHLNQAKEQPLSALNCIGKPVSEEARQKAYEECKEIGLSSEEAWLAVKGIAEQIERDKPFEAQRIGMKYLDLTGYYRVLARMLSEMMKTERRNGEQV